MTTKEKLLKTIDGAKTLGADFRYRDLSGMNFENCSLAGIDFRGSNLSNCTFEKCDLSFCLFDHANLQGSSFDNVKANHALLRYANFNGSEFHKVNLAYCELHQSKFLDCKIVQMIIDRSSVYMASFSAERLGLKFTNCDGAAMKKTIEQ